MQNQGKASVVLFFGGKGENNLGNLKELYRANPQFD